MSSVVGYHTQILRLNDTLNMFLRVSHTAPRWAHTCTVDLAAHSSQRCTNAPWDVDRTAQGPESTCRPSRSCRSQLVIHELQLYELLQLRAGLSNVHNVQNEQLLEKPCCSRVVDTRRRKPLVWRRDGGRTEWSPFERSPFGLQLTLLL